jgi:hypothetical protein
MKSIVAILLLLASALIGTGAAVFERPEDQKSFLIYDNLFYKGKPDTAKDGLIASNVLYEDKIWPDKQAPRVLPSREAFEALVREHATNPGPLVIDIEHISLRSSPESARQSMKLLAQLADWAHEAVPGKVIGYYGTNTLSNVLPANEALARELTSHVDAFFPPIYNFDDNRTNWEKRAQAAQAEAHALDAKKPVYFYLWPQYHVGSARALRYVDGDYWRFQLETAHRYGDGVVLWGPDAYAWNDKSGWWYATEKFAASLHAGAKD